MSDNWKLYIQHAKKNYEKIGAIPCPAFGGELIYFNKYGLKHLMRKGASLRDLQERQRRTELISIAVNTLATSTTYDQYRKTERTSWSDGSISIAEFWSFCSTHDEKQVIVIVRCKNKGRKHFFSVM